MRGRTCLDSPTVHREVGEESRSSAQCRRLQSAVPQGRPCPLLGDGDYGNSPRAGLSAPPPCRASPPPWAASDLREVTCAAQCPPRPLSGTPAPSPLRLHVPCPHFTQDPRGPSLSESLPPGQTPTSKEAALRGWAGGGWPCKREMARSSLPPPQSPHRAWPPSPPAPHPATAVRFLLVASGGLRVLPDKIKSVSALRLPAGARSGRSVNACWAHPVIPLL